MVRLGFPQSLLNLYHEDSVYDHLTVVLNVFTAHYRMFAYRLFISLRIINQVKVPDPEALVKLEAAEERNDKLQKENVNLQTKINGLQTKISDLKSRIGDLEAKVLWKSRDLT